MTKLTVSKTGRFLHQKSMEKTLVFSREEIDLLKSLIAQVSVNPTTEKALETARTVYELSKKLE